MAIRTSFLTAQNRLPSQGSILIPITLIMAGGSVAQDVDLVLEEGGNVFDFAQAMFVDNSANASALTITFSGAAIPIIVPSLSQGIFPAYAAGNGAIQMHVNCPGAGATVTIALLNHPSPFFVWKV